MSDATTQQAAFCPDGRILFQVLPADQVSEDNTRDLVSKAVAGGSHSPVVRIGVAYNHDGQCVVAHAGKEKIERTPLDVFLKTSETACTYSRFIQAFHPAENSFLARQFAQTVDGYVGRPVDILSRQGNGDINDWELISEAASQTAARMQLSLGFLREDLSLLELDLQSQDFLGYRTNTIRGNATDKTRVLLPTLLMSSPDLVDAGFSMVKTDSVGASQCPRSTLARYEQIAGNTWQEKLETLKADWATSLAAERVVVKADAFKGVTRYVFTVQAFKDETLPVTMLFLMSDKPDQLELANQLGLLIEQSKRHVSLDESPFGSGGDAQP